jgi:selenocysteine lyase/cysteine desulfurase
MSPEQFRNRFPALRSMVWLDTPAAPPGAEPVVPALQEALSAWSGGEFSCLSWNQATDEAPELFARFLDVQAGTVSTHGSVAEAAATVAGSLPPGRIVVPAQEFRSNLFPWYARHEVVAVPARSGTTHVEDLTAALNRQTVLLAVSEVTSLEGQRLDLPALRVATDRLRARLFVDLTQSLGALRHDADAVRADYRPGDQ